jgi:sporulation protein YlmC with PRC-barrel domain
MKNFNSDNNSGINHEGVNTNRPLRFLTASSIMGDKVLNKKEEHMGSIKDIMIDLETGKIEYYIVEIGGFLGIGEKFFAFPYRLLTVDSVSETFLLDQDLEVLKNAPGFDKEHWPDTNSHQFENSGTYWGGFIGVNSGSVPY